MDVCTVLFSKCSDLIEVIFAEQVCAVWAEPVERIKTIWQGELLLTLDRIGEPLVCPFHSLCERQRLGAIGFKQVWTAVNAHARACCNFECRVGQVVHVERCGDATEQRLECCKFGADHNCIVRQHSNFCRHQSAKKIFQVHVIAEAAKQRHAHVGVSVDHARHHNATLGIDDGRCIVSEFSSGNCANLAICTNHDRCIVDNGADCVDSDNAGVGDCEKVLWGTH